MILNGNNDRQGVLMTPCRFYFGCYIDTLCGRTLRNRMSGAAARHFFFSGKGADRVRLYWNQPTSQKTPRRRRGTANAAVGGAGASIAQMYICTACRGYPGPLCRLLAEKLAAIRRRKEKNVDENKKEHHLHIVLTTQQYQLLCCQAKECRLTKRAYLARLIEGRPVKARPTKEIKELRTEIHHIGNNINQIARSVNAGIAKPEDAERGLYLLDQVYELMFRIANK